MTGRSGRVPGHAALTLALLCSTVGARAAAPAVTISPPVAVTDAAPEPSLGWEPALASSGENMLVAYLADVFQPLLMGRLLDTEGAPLGLPFVLAEQAHRDAPPSVVFDGEQYIVSWQLQSGALYYRRFSEEAEPIGSAELVDATVSGSPAHAVGVGEAGALFVTCELEQCSTRLLAGGELGEAQTFATLGTAGHVSLTHSDGVWLVAIGYVSGGGMLAQLSGDGAAMPGLRHDLDIADPYNAPQVAAVSDGFVVAWVPDDQLQLGRIDFDGELTLAPVWTNDTQRPKALRATGADLVLYATQPRSDCINCGFADRLLRVDAALAPVGDALPLSGFGNIATTSIGSSQFIADDAVGHIVGARVDLVPGGLSIALTEPWSVSATEQHSPRSAPAGEGWLVAWQERPGSPDVFQRVRAGFVSASGQPQGDALDVGPAEARLMDVACTAGGCLIALAPDPGFQVEPLKGEFYRIRSDDHALDSAPGVWSDNVSLAASEHSLLMATVQAQSRELLLRLHDDDGALLEESLLVPLQTPASVQRPVPLDVKLDGDEFVVVWYDQSQVWSSRVPVTGPLAPAPAQLLFSEQELAALEVTFSGASWWAGSRSQAGFSWRSDAREPEALTQPIESVVSTHGVALATFGWSYAEGSTLAMAGPGEGWTELALLEDPRAHLSAPREGKALLSSPRRDTSWGAPVWRIDARVLTVEGDLGAGGAPGGVGAGGEGGESTPGESGAAGDGAGAMSDAGAASEPNGQGGRGGSAGAPARPTRHSQGCGCRAPGVAAHSSAAWLLLLASVLALGRRSRRRECLRS